MELTKMVNKMMDFIKYKGAVWKIPLAAALSWELAEWAGSKHPYLAPLTVILSIQLTVDKSIQFAWQRIMGTIAGVLFTASIAPYVGLNGWSIGFLLFVGALIVTWLKLDHAIMIQVALSILLVMYFQSKMPSYSLDRIRDTVIGAVIALLIHMLIFPPDSVNKAKKKMIHFTDHLSNHFVNIALWVKEGCSSSEAQTLQTELQTLFRELHQATTELDKAEQSVRYNPLGRKKRDILKKLNQKMHQLRSGYANSADMIRVLAKWSESGNFAKEDQRIWAVHLNTLAGFVKEWKSVLDDPASFSLASNGSALQIKAPANMENYQYPLALYMNAEQVIQDFQNVVFPNKAL
ncbi:aromatic acid exporter family protein [Paenibacillus profundus]|uniref:Aromatic acid exporter family protein n=1 Tax=Paenibacillus profundus TaxID=1173085 RepID=A0ABS8YNX9_9BACL|nr:aromatic acid exporter family protein [Paenibacillus profundus]MCE5172330.1 aromatic acid exporter family protein [Paenibacillus profundus]